MLRKIFLLLGSGLMVMQLNAAPIPRDDLPQGNYKEFCNSCEINDDNQLSCMCAMLPTTEQADPLESDDLQFSQLTLDLDNCDFYKVEYLGGYLVCDNTDEEDAESVRGTEKEAVVTEDGEVIPEPEDVVFTPDEDDVSAPPEDKAPASEPEAQPEPDPELLEEIKLGNLPVGDYIQYCNSCRIENGRLYCECDDGSYFSSAKPSIDMNRCGRNGTVTYYRGALMCQRDFLNITQSLGGCSNCTVDGNAVTCICKRTPCQWSRRDLDAGRRNKESSLEGFRFCTSQIVNCNGQLRCGGCRFYDYYEEYRRPYEGEVVGEYCHHIPDLLHSVEDFFLLRW